MKMKMVCSPSSPVFITSRLPFVFSSGFLSHFYSPYYHYHFSGFCSFVCVFLSLLLFLLPSPRPTCNGFFWGGGTFSKFYFFRLLLHLRLRLSLCVIPFLNEYFRRSASFLFPFYNWLTSFLFPSLTKAFQDIFPLRYYFHGPPQESTPNAIFDIYFQDPNSWVLQEFYLGDLLARFTLKIRSKLYILLSSLEGHAGFSALM